MTFTTLVGEGGSGEDLRYDFSVDVGESEIPALKGVGEPFLLTA